MRISVDFDETLTLPVIEKLCKILIAANVDLWILTSRSQIECDNADIHATCDRIGLDVNKIIYTAWEPKVDYVKKYGIQIHLENDLIETTEINVYQPHTALLVSFELGNVNAEVDYMDIRLKDKNDE